MRYQNAMGRACTTDPVLGLWRIFRSLSDHINHIAYRPILEVNDTCFRVNLRNRFNGLMQAAVLSAVNPAHISRVGVAKSVFIGTLPLLTGSRG